ncbi:MAG: AgmX/PglI C-terminal domain-containing protein, partial [Myxococcaceae bacterium]
MGNALARFRGCYANRLADAPKLCARFTLEFVVTATGSTTGAIARPDTADDPVLEACVLNALREVDFPRPSEVSAVTVSVPLVFARYVRE